MFIGDYPYRDIARTSLFTLEHSLFPSEYAIVLRYMHANSSDALARVELQGQPILSGVRALNAMDVLLLEPNRTSVYRANFTSGELVLVKEVAFAYAVFLSVDVNGFSYVCFFSLAR